MSNQCRWWILAALALPIVFAGGVSAQEKQDPRDRKKDAQPKGGAAQSGLPGPGLNVDSPKSPPATVPGLGGLKGKGLGNAQSAKPSNVKIPGGKLTGRGIIGESPAGAKRSGVGPKPPARGLSGPGILGGGSQTGRPAQPHLNPKILNAVQQQVLPAYYRGNTIALLDAIADLLPRVNEIQLAEINDLLASGSAPSIVDMLLEARLNLVLQQKNEGVKAPGLHELLVLAPEIQRRIAATATESQDHEAMRATLPAPRDFSEYERLFWRIHVLEQRLNNARQLADYGKQLQSRSRRYARRASEQQREILQLSFDVDAQDLAELYQELVERKIELRVQRLELAQHKLLTTEDRRQKLDAAYVTQLDGRLLTEFFDQLDEQRKKGTVTLRRSSLQDESLAREVRQLIKDASGAAGDLAEKGNLLYTGIHWWLRGRYGRGTEGGGLLKPKSALNSPATMFQLYMPEQLYEVDEQSKSAIQAPINRRHHYIWAFEPRRIVNKQHNSESKLATTQATSKTTLSYFY